MILNIIIKQLGLFIIDLYPYRIIDLYPFTGHTGIVLFICRIFTFFHLVKMLTLLLLPAV